MKNPEELKAGLYIVATPIGNLRDITLRALDTLKSVDIIFCEDTRVSGKLLKAYDIRKPLKKYNDHSDSRVRAEIVQFIKEGKAVALISDAGTPLICDPGYKLVVECQASGLNMTSIPGANAPITALQVSGMASDSFSFVGFLPPKTKARRDFLAKWKHVPGVLITFETAPRLLTALEDIQFVMGLRDVAVVREISKLYEEVRRSPVDELISYYKGVGPPKGEIVLVIEQGACVEYSDDDLDNMIRSALKTMRSKDAASFISEQTGVKKSDLYNLALRVQEDEV